MQSLVQVGPNTRTELDKMCRSGQWTRSLNDHIHVYGEYTLEYTLSLMISLHEQDVTTFWGRGGGAGGLCCHLLTPSALSLLGLGGCLLTLLPTDHAGPGFPFTHTHPHSASCVSVSAISVHVCLCAAVSHGFVQTP